MKKLIAIVFALGGTGLAQAAESLDDWGPWAIDHEQAATSGYDVEAYDLGVNQHIPMASDLEDSFTPVGLAESALNDVGGTVNDLIADALEQNPGDTIDDVLDDVINLLP